MCQISSGHIEEVAYYLLYYANILKICFNFIVWPQHK